MSLDRVGTGNGPDVARLRDVVEQAGARSVYASGGMRDSATSKPPPRQVPEGR